MKWKRNADDDTDRKSHEKSRRLNDEAKALADRLVAHDNVTANRIG
jgi:hypothetical protein